MDNAKAVTLAEFGVSIEELVQFQAENELGKRVRHASSFCQVLNGNLRSYSLQASPCWHTTVSLPRENLLWFSPPSLIQIGTCRDKEWTFLWSRRPLLSWSKVLFIIVSQYSPTVN